ncbi:MAG: energy transducer TonB [Rhodocyclaceae bacterium]|nr:MAG: energy transducer TonB [Rhodocyclaceae bacterium]
MTTLVLSHHAQDTGLKVSLSTGQWALVISLLAHVVILAWPHRATRSAPPSRPPLLAMLLPAQAPAQSTAPAPAVRTMQAHASSRPPAPVLTSAAKAMDSAPTTPAANIATPIATPVAPPIAASVTAPVLPPPGATPGANAATTLPGTSLHPPSAATLASYGQTLSERLGRLQRYPRLAEMRGWQGEVQLHLRIARKGALLDVQIARSSGYDILDRNALQLVQDSAPLPAPPDTLGGGELDIVVPIHYRLGKT